MKKILLSLIIVLTASVFAFAQDAAAKEYTNQDNTTTVESQDYTPSGDTDALSRHKKPKLSIALFAAVPRTATSSSRLTLPNCKNTFKKHIFH